MVWFFYWTVVWWRLKLHFKFSARNPQIGDTLGKKNIAEISVSGIHRFRHAQLITSDPFSLRQWINNHRCRQYQDTKEEKTPWENFHQEKTNSFCVPMICRYQNTLQSLVRAPASASAQLLFIPVSEASRKEPRTTASLSPDLQTAGDCSKGHAGHRLTVRLEHRGIVQPAAEKSHLHGRSLSAFRMYFHNDRRLHLFRQFSLRCEGSHTESSEWLPVPYVSLLWILGWR